MADTITILCPSSGTQTAQSVTPHGTFSLGLDRARGALTDAFAQVFIIISETDTRDSGIFAVTGGTWTSPTFQNLPVGPAEIAAVLFQDSAGNVELANDGPHPIEIVAQGGDDCTGP